MEWNLYWNQNDVTRFSPFESTGDSEEVKSDVYNPPHYDNYGHAHAQDEVVKDVYEDLSYRFKEGEYNYNDNDNDNDDDAQSCSYDHSSYINYTSYSNSYNHGQSQMLVYDGDDHDNNDGDVVDDDEINKNLGESKTIDPSNDHNFCVDSSNDQREIDRRFWENCFAT